MAAFFIKFGFPLDVDRSQTFKSDQINHQSAKKFPQHVDYYIQEEIKHGAMLGPFSSPPIPLHTSPFLTREKSGSENRRVIVDLSWPKGNSVNNAVNPSSYMGVEFLLTLPTIDQVTKAVKKFGRNSFIAKIDISRAFKHVPIDPGDIDLLGLHWHDFFIEKNLVFGFKFGSQIFERISNSIRFIMAQNGYYILDYIDDYLIFGNEVDCKRAFDRLTSLLQELGFTISVHKNVLPSQQVSCLGILVDTKNFTVSVPEDKLSDIMKLLDLWTDKTSCTKREFQSLLGSLLYISKCVRYARFFLNRLLENLRTHANSKIITLDENSYKDIAWFKKFVQVFNGTSFFLKKKVDKEVHLDACLKGIGATFNGFIYEAKIPGKFAHFDIAALEMLNILVALRVWADAWKNCTIEVHCDNLSVVTVLCSGKTKNSSLATISRNIFMVASRYDIFLKVSHIPGKENKIADLLSRWDNSPSNILKLRNLLPSHNWVEIEASHFELDDNI